MKVVHEDLLHEGNEDKLRNNRRHSKHLLAHRLICPNGQWMHDEVQHGKPDDSLIEENIQEALPNLCAGHLKGKQMSTRR